MFSGFQWYSTLHYSTTLIYCLDAKGKEDILCSPVFSGTLHYSTLYSIEWNRISWENIANYVLRFLVILKTGERLRFTVVAKREHLYVSFYKTKSIFSQSI